MSAPMTSPSPELARRMANAIRMLAVDAVEQAKSGHPGAPMGMADIAEVLWNRHLRHNPANPHWPDRDRFVLSNGHGSMLLYALLHLTGYDLPMDELKKLPPAAQQDRRPPRSGRHARAWKPPPARWARASPTPWAWRWPRSCWRPSSTARPRTSATIVDHFTYAFLGDGCMMEGISHEACSLAGTLRLSKLVALLRRQRHLHRRPRRRLVHRRHAQRVSTPTAGT